MKRDCGCWDCCRMRGETPRMEGLDPDSEAPRRTLPPYPHHGTRERIPANVDITGNDRKRGAYRF